MIDGVVKSVISASGRVPGAVFAVLLVLASCGKGGKEQSTRSITITENGQSTWAIAYGKAGSEATAFVNAFAHYTGCTLRSYPESEEQNSHEIIIGRTSRPETTEVLKDVANGYRIAFHGDKLVVAGTDDTWNAVALYEFERRILKSGKYLSAGTLKIPSDFERSDSNDDPQTIGRLLRNGYDTFGIEAEKVMSCAGEGVVKVAQGAASDGTYVFFCLRNSGDSQAMVFKYDLATGQQAAKSAVFNGGHCNDMTLNTRTSTLYVAHGSAAPKVLTPIAAGDLSIKLDKTISVGTGAISYNAVRNCYAISQGGKNLVLCDAGFNKVQSYTRTDDTGYTAQGMGCDDHYVYFPMSSGADNILVAYDWSGNYAATLKINVALEAESMFYAGGNYYVNFHSGGANLYRITPELNYIFSN